MNYMTSYPSYERESWEANHSLKCVECRRWIREEDDYRETDDGYKCMNCFKPCDAHGCQNEQHPLSSHGFCVKDEVEFWWDELQEAWKAKPYDPQATVKAEAEWRTWKELL